MTKREKINNFYVERKVRSGQFANWVGIGKSLKADRLIKSDNKVKSGYGHQGDQ